MNTPCGHFDVENDALFGVDRSLLIVGRLDPRQTTALSERGVRIRLADPLRFAGRSYLGRWRRRTTSPVAILTAMHAFTVHDKTALKRSGSQRWRMRVRLE
jgi:hypothetical protein